MMRFIGQFRRRLSSKKINEYKMLASEGDARARELLSGRGNSQYLSGQSNIDRSLDGLKELEFTKVLLPHIVRGQKYAIQSKVNPYYIDSGDKLDLDEIKVNAIHDGNHSIVPQDIGKILAKLDVVSDFTNPDYFRRRFAEIPLSLEQYKEYIDNYEGNLLNRGFMPPLKYDTIWDDSTMFSSDGKTKLPESMRTSGKLLNQLQEQLVTEMEGGKIPFQGELANLQTLGYNQNWQEDLDKLTKIARKIAKHRPRKLYGSKVGRILSKIIRGTPNMGRLSTKELVTSNNLRPFNTL